jgi:hypothetical protein
MKNNNNGRLFILNLLPALSFILSLNFFPLILKAQDGVKPEEFIVEPPTLNNLGFDMPRAQGDYYSPPILYK